MKKIFYLIIIFFALLTTVVTAKDININNIDISKYPEIKIEFNVSYDYIVNNKSIKIKENGTEITTFSLKPKKNPVEKNKNILILIEDMSEKTHPGQKKFIKSVIEKSLCKILNDGDKVNVVFFNRSHKGASLIHPILKNYSSGCDTVLKAIKDFKSKNDVFYKQTSSDLYYAVYDGLQELYRKFPNDSKVLLLFSAGKNNRESQEIYPDRSIAFAREHRIPIYSVQYFMPGWEHNRITSLIKGTNGDEIVTNDVDAAYFFLQNAFKEAQNVIEGKTFETIYKTGLPKNGESRNITIYVNNVPVTAQYVAPKKTFKDYVNIITSNVYYLIAFILIVILIIGIIIFLILHKRKKNKLIKEKLNHFEKLETENKKVIKKYEEKISGMEEQYIQNKKRQTIQNLNNKLKEKALHGLQPRIVLFHEGKKQIIPLNKLEVTIGRQEGNDIILNYSNISRVHAKIFFDGNSFIIKDLNSSNGTFVNNRKIKSHPLKHNDFIKIGSSELMYIE